jgi:hypothetical protein
MFFVICEEEREQHKGGGGLSYGPSSFLFIYIWQNNILELDNWENISKSLHYYIIS